MGEEKEAVDCLIARSPDCQISVAIIAGEVSQLGVEEGRNRPEEMGECGGNRNLLQPSNLPP